MHIKKLYYLVSITLCACSVGNSNSNNNPITPSSPLSLNFNEQDVAKVNINSIGQIKLELINNSINPINIQDIYLTNVNKNDEIKNLFKIFSIIKLQKQVQPYANLC